LLVLQFEKKYQYFDEISMIKIIINHYLNDYFNHVIPSDN